MTTEYVCTNSIQHALVLLTYFPQKGKHMTPLKFDKRLRDKHIKSGELTQEELSQITDALEDSSSRGRYFDPNATAEGEGGDTQAEAGPDEQLEG